MEVSPEFYEEDISGWAGGLKILFQSSDAQYFFRIRKILSCRCILLFLSKMVNYSHDLDFIG